MTTENLVEYAERMKALPIQDSIIEMAKLKDEIDELKPVLSELNKKFDTMRLNVLPEKMDEEDIATVTIDTNRGKFRVSLFADAYFSILAENRETAYQWLRDNGHGDLVIETVNASSGKAWAKEVVKSGGQLPEGIFNFTPFTRAQLTRVKS